ncbi:hypothetical protein BN940_03111 [Castellaniella defragrans 65Phen]|uniref:Uncharacterized protein n=1 Tax=Castellaniella defragrans (strain DSM 12143 / CCUG 39792 / 65Phen) TaxID=1437824 RepID=W8X1D4_CASD6|nr:hypothetical protein BN940_03111 [Castellaniella defragrans 65Phen]
MECHVVSRSGYGRRRRRPVFACTAESLSVAPRRCRKLHRARVERNSAPRREA